MSAARLSDASSPVFLTTGVPTFGSAIPFVILSSYLSDRYKKRGVIMAIGYTTALIGWIMVRQGLLFDVSLKLYSILMP
jgi:uncharacterized membrane protein (UPF0136 family)